jgi:hypothetical protein
MAAKLASLWREGHAPELSPASARTLSAQAARALRFAGVSLPPPALLEGETGDATAGCSYGAGGCGDEAEESDADGSFGDELEVEAEGDGDEGGAVVLASADGRGEEGSAGDVFALHDDGDWDAEGAETGSGAAAAVDTLGTGTGGVDSCGGPGGAGAAPLSTAGAAAARASKRDRSLAASASSSSSTSGAAAAPSSAAPPGPLSHLPLEAQVISFIRSRPALHEAALLLDCLDGADLHAGLRAAGVRVTLQELKGVLGRMGVSVATRWRQPKPRTLQGGDRGADAKRGPKKAAAQGKGAPKRKPAAATSGVAAAAGACGATNSKALSMADDASRARGLSAAEAKPPPKLKRVTAAALPQSR